MKCVAPECAGHTGVDPTLRSQAEFFTTLCRRYLAGQLVASEYICAFETLYTAAEITLSEREFLVFDDIQTNNDRFEASHQLRRSDTYLIDETELRRLIQKGIGVLAV